MGEVLVYIEDFEGYIEEVKVVFNNDKDCIYVVFYVFKVVGLYKVIVFFVG